MAVEIKGVTVIVSGALAKKIRLLAVKAGLAPELLCIAILEEYLAQNDAAIINLKPVPNKE